MTSSRLYGVVRPLPTESPTSWAQRICQQYDMTYSRFLACIGKRPARDIDLALQPEDYLALSTLCGIELSAFDWMRHSLGRCAWMRELRELLRFRGRVLPSYRFCSLCWREDSIPFLRLEWRFAQWTICPTHRTQMSECCPICCEPLHVHRAILGGGDKVVGSLACCYCCGADLRLCTSPLLEADADGFVARTINTQRSIVSAVVHGYFFVDRFGERALPVKRLPPWIRHDVLEGVVRLDELRPESGRFDARIDHRPASCTSPPLSRVELLKWLRRKRAAESIAKQKRHTGQAAVSPMMAGPESSNEEPVTTTPAQRTAALSWGLNILAGLAARPNISSDALCRALLIIDFYPTPSAVRDWLEQGLPLLPQDAADAIEATSSLFSQLRGDGLLDPDLRLQIDEILRHFPPAGTASSAASVGFFGGLDQWLSLGPIP